MDQSRLLDGAQMLMADECGNGGGGGEGGDNGPAGAASLGKDVAPIWC